MSCPFRLPLRLAALALCAFLVQPVTAAQTDHGQPYDFSPLDFTQEADVLTGICITALPEEGCVMLGNRVIRSGDVLTAAQLEQMTFVPVSSMQDGVVEVLYLPIFSDHVAGETALTISIRGRENEAPVAEDSAVETYKNLPSEGLLRITDPEGEQLVFTVTRQPRRGSVIIREDGSYLYTPDKNKVGTDSFTFTAADPAGNVSREATVTVRILKPTDELQYTDTAGLGCRFAAEWMRQTGIFSGETISGQLCFSPQREVTRGQFLAMLMETLEMPVDRSVTESVFLDESPLWLRPYLAAALRCGLITGYPGEGGAEFRPEQGITAQEAAGMIQSALHFALPTAIDSDGAVAAWASDDADFALPQGEGVLTRAETAALLYQVSKLKSQSPGLSLFLGQ